MAVLEQWALGAAAIVAAACTIMFVLWLLYAPECEEFREGVVFLGFIAALIAGLTLAPYEFGKILSGSSPQAEAKP